MTGLILLHLGAITCFSKTGSRNVTKMLVLMSSVLLCFLICPSNGIPSSSSRRVVAAIPGDLVVGALFPVHHAPILKHAHTRRCTEIREQYGIQRIEASFLTIDTINSDDSILPNITLGLEIRDSCWYSPIALEQSIEFIRDAMAAGEDQSSSSSSFASSLLNNQLSAYHDPNSWSAMANRTFRTGAVDPFLRSYSIPTRMEGDDGELMSPSAQISGPLDPFWLIRNSFKNSSSPTATSATGSSSGASLPVSPLPPGMCPKQGKKVKNIVGVIGPASSSVTIQVQNLLQLFNIPQIGYSATSRDLSVKSYYKYFLRVVPSDLLQARVMVDLMMKNNWTYISAVYTDGNYGSSLMEVFKNLAHESGICIANTETVFNNAEDEMFDSILKTLLLYKSTARVVACFCEGMTVRGLLKSMRRLNVAGELLLIGSDGWSDRYDVIEGYEVEAVGGISVRIYSPYVNEFDPYYFSLHPDNNTRNPWFREFWEHRFNCTLASSVTQSSPDPGSINQSRGHSSFSSSSGNPRSYTNLCTGNERLNDSKYKQDTKMAFVMKSIWTMAYGLHNMQRDLCPHTSGLCSNMLPLDGSLFLQYLMNVTFKWQNETIAFDEYGDPPGRYDIMNLQKVSVSSFEYVHVGSWISLTSPNSNGGNEFDLFRPFQWPVKSLPVNSSSPIPESVCSKPCPKGQAKNIQSDSVKCCWVCVPCQRNQYLKDEYTCVDCDLGWWPNDDLTSGCYQIDIEYIQWTETPSLIAISLAIMGIMVTLMCMVVFIKHNNTPVVKASTRELSYMILIGMMLAHSTTFFLVMKPSQEVCFMTRILPGFSFAVIYASLVTKTNRIARILAGSKKRIMTKKLKFMSSFAQVIISLIIIMIESAILAAVLVLEPADSKLDYPSLDQVKLICNTSTLGVVVPLGFDFFLILMCTVYAVKTRNVPENFNEAKWIGFTMYTTLVIWIAFIPLYFGSQLKVLTMCISISLSAIVALALLYFPKCYIMIFTPEKNNRSFFTTAKNVRCHIGYVPTVGISRYSSRLASDMSSSNTDNKEKEIDQMHHPRIQTMSSTGKAVSMSVSADHRKSEGQLSSGRGQLHGKNQEGVKIGTFGSMKKSLNIFERLRSSKQDKIAADVQKKIIAVRAAEDLDRRTNAKRNAGRGVSSGANFNPRSYSSEQTGRPSLIEETTEGSVKSQEPRPNKSDKTSQSDPPARMRMIALLKNAFGEEALEKIPGFTDFETITRQELIDFNKSSGSHYNLRRMKSFQVDASTQTTLDLLETYLKSSSPRISSRGAVIAPINGTSSPSSINMNNLSSSSGNAHQRIWESSQPLNGRRQAWLVGQSTESSNNNPLPVSGPILMTAPVHMNQRQVTQYSNNGMKQYQVPPGVSIASGTTTMAFGDPLGHLGVRMRQDMMHRQLQDEGNQMSLKNQNVSCVTSFPGSGLPSTNLGTHFGHQGIMSGRGQQQQPLLSNLRTTSSGLPEPLPPPIDFGPVHGPISSSCVPYSSCAASFSAQLEQQLLESSTEVTGQRGGYRLQSSSGTQRTRSRGSTTSNQRSSEESLHFVSAATGGVTPGQQSVVEESASSGGDSSPSSSGAVYKNIIITLASSSRLTPGHQEEEEEQLDDEEDDDRERLNLGSYDDEDDENLSLGPGLEHHHGDTSLMSEQTTSSLSHLPPPPGQQHHHSCPRHPR